MDKMICPDYPIMFPFTCPIQARSSYELIEYILDKVLEYSDGVTRKQLFGKTRKKDVIYARHVVGFFLRRYTPATLKFIGTLMGDRDHTTVINSVHAVDGMLDTDFPPVQHYMALMTTLFRYWRVYYDTPSASRFITRKQNQTHAPER